MIKMVPRPIAVSNSNCHVFGLRHRGAPLAASDATAKQPAAFIRKFRASSP